MINVKSVILPKGGISYNPSMNDHQKVLKEVAGIEEKQVKQELKDLRKVYPLQYGEQAPEEPEDDGEEGEEESSEEIDSSDEEIDADAPLGINQPVDRNNLKTQAQRNKATLVKKKLQDKE